MSKLLLGVMNTSSLVGLSLSGFGVLGSSSFSLFSQLISLNLLALLLVDGFNQDSLVLELVTLAGHIEEMIQMLIDFLGFSVFSEESSENSLSSDPENLLWHSCFLGTFSLNGLLKTPEKVSCRSPRVRKEETLARPQ